MVAFNFKFSAEKEEAPKKNYLWDTINTFSYPKKLIINKRKLPAKQRDLKFIVIFANAHCWLNHCMNIPRQINKISERETHK